MACTYIVKWMYIKYSTYWQHKQKQEIPLMCLRWQIFSGDHFTYLRCVYVCVSLSLSIHIIIIFVVGIITFSLIYTSNRATTDRKLNISCVQWTKNRWKNNNNKRAKVIESTTTVLHILYTYSKKKCPMWWRKRNQSRNSTQFCQFYCVVYQYHYHCFCGWVIWHLRFSPTIQRIVKVRFCHSLRCIFIEQRSLFIIYLGWYCSHYSDNTTISPTRWLFSTLVPILLMSYGLKRKGVNKSGAALGLFVAIILSLANHAFLACLAIFFFSSSRVTKFRGHLKRKFEADFKGGELLSSDNNLTRVIETFHGWNEILNWIFMILIYLCNGWQVKGSETGSKCCVMVAWQCN